MTAIRLAFFAVAVGFGLLALQQGWLAFDLLGAAGENRSGWIALGAAAASLAAAVATVWTALKVR